MPEYICCRSCDSPSCKGCNIYTLSTMLNKGKFDSLMNDNRSINPTADVAEVRHGYWITHFDDLFPAESTQECSVCHEEEDITLYNDNFCPNCGADMRGEKDG